MGPGDLTLPTETPKPADGQPQIPQPSMPQAIFIGADGLRSGWSALLFMILFALLLAGVITVAQKIHPISRDQLAGKDTSPGFILIGDGLPFFGLFLIAWVMSKIEGRPNSVYGLGGRRKLAHFLAGLAWGVILLSAFVFALSKMGLLVFDGRLLFGRDVVRQAAVWVIVFIFVGLMEEYLLRGYLQYTLARGFAGFYRWAFKARQSAAVGFWTAALLLSSVFGLGHGKNPGESPIGLLSAGLIGLIFCLSLWRTGSLWWAIGMHAGWDWAQSFLYGVADSGTMIANHLMASHPVGRPLLSGGATGPEGSIYILVVLAFITLIIFLTLRHTGAYAANMPGRKGDAPSPVASLTEGNGQVTAAT